MEPADNPFQKKNVFILGAGSDIGAQLASMFSRRGARVFGTFRTESSVAELRHEPGIELFPCDVAKSEEVRLLAANFGALKLPWDIFVSTVGILDPIGKFFDLDFEQWENSVRVNSLSQLRALHALNLHRRPGGVCHAFFFAGGGTNSPFRNFSAYCLGKIMLIKMCELLDDEDPLLNAVILGTGWVNTKIHRQTLESNTAAGESLGLTEAFLKAPEKGTSFDDIYGCIEWCVRSGRELVGGRNFSIVHDAWRNGGKPLLEQLQRDRNQYKLRRYGNS